MATRYLPLFLRHSPTPSVRDFALLAGIEAAVRGTLISAMPLTVYAALGNAEDTSAAYFHAGIAALIIAMPVMVEQFKGVIEAALDQSAVLLAQEASDG